MPFPNEDTQFKKGESGNPNGRPRKLEALDTMLEKILGEEKDGVNAAEAILMAMRNKATKGDIRAAELLLDRFYGKPKQPMELLGKTKISLEIERTTTDRAKEDQTSNTPSQPADGI